MNTLKLLDWPHIAVSGGLAAALAFTLQAHGVAGMVAAISAGGAVALAYVGALLVEAGWRMAHGDDRQVPPTG